MKYLLAAKFSEVEPLGLMYLSSTLKRFGHEVDMCLYRQDPYYEILPKVLTFKPDLIGFSVYTGGHLPIYEACRKIREFGIETAIGGPHTIYFMNDCRQYADYVFQGESLQSFPLMDDKSRYPLFEVDMIPHPDRKLLYSVSSFHKDNRIKNIMASFGCPYDCSYCYNPSYKAMYPDFKVRLRPVDDVIDEAREIEAEMIFFQDDCFGTRMDWLEEFASKWDGRPYHCQMRFEMATDERLDLLVASGCTGITCAIECAALGVRYMLLNRHVSDERILDGARRIKAHGLRLRTEQMLGIPETGLDDELELLQWNVTINPDIAWCSIYQPYRGTNLGEYCVSKGLYYGNNDDISDTFFEGSILNYSQERKSQIRELQKIFSVCAHLPKGHDLARKVLNGKSLVDSSRAHFYNILYA